MTFVANLLLFTHTLRRVGLAISLEQSLECALALELVDLGQREQVYYATRSLLVKRKEEIGIFDLVFNRFWQRAQSVANGQKMPIAPRHNIPLEQERATIVTLMAQRARQADPELDVADRAGRGSNAELLQRKAFSQMTPEELETVKRLIEQLHWQVSQRTTRRRTPDRRGEFLHIRPMLRAAAKQQGVVLKLHWQTRKVKRRPLVILADISGSMEKYARLLLQFAYSLTHGLGNVESFVFGTRLSHITPQLRLRNIDRAISEAAGNVQDWAGGTRIGESLRRFNVAWSRRVLRRGAIVLILSDGCDCGEVAILKQAMRYLQHRCYRLIWLNPLAGDPRYQPLVAGMAAALPFVDDFLPIHNLQSLQQLAQKLAAARA